MQHFSKISRYIISYIIKIIDINIENISSDSYSVWMNGILFFTKTFYYQCAPLEKIIFNPSTIFRSYWTTKWRTEAQIFYSWLFTYACKCRGNIYLLFIFVCYCFSYRLMYQRCTNDMCVCYYAYLPDYLKSFLAVLVCKYYYFLVKTFIILRFPTNS